MTLSILFDGVVLLVLRRHDFIKMNLIVEKVVKVEPLERLEHLLDAFLEVLDQVLVFNFKLAFRKKHVLLLNSLSFLVKDSLKDVVLIVFRLYLSGFQVNDLPQLIHRV